jgi:alkanesulfonate monooxygenase SsuD/methylene tetrahydromethanopterin reductase-like flavin-dependent oxidoreductase (luciferase family)
MLAVGVGWSAGEYRNLGHNFHDRGKRMDEAIKVLRTLWRGGEVISFKGEYYSFEQFSFRPARCNPAGRCCGGGNSRVALRRALTLSDALASVTHGAG